MRTAHALLVVSFIFGGCFVDRRGTRATREMDGAVRLDARPPMGDGAGCPGFDITSDPDRCGECGNVCLRVPNATSTCVESRCGIECDPSHGDCDADSTTGCEVPLDGNPSNCGGCGVECGAMALAPNTVSTGCAGGVCQVECTAGFGDCDASPTNGCEIDLTNSRSHCGSCGFTCPLAARSRPFCETGACRVLCDEPRYRDCNGVPTDGCEEDVQDDFACGLCPGDPGVEVCGIGLGECLCEMSGCGCTGIFP